MKKTNIYFRFSSVFTSMVLMMLMLVQVQASAQSCPLQCQPGVNLSISPKDNEPANTMPAGSQLQNCETEVIPADLLTVGGLIDASTCAAANGLSLQTQVKRNGFWTPAPGNGNAILTANDIGKNIEVRVIAYKPANGAILNSCWGTYLVEDKQAPKIVCPKDATLSCAELAPGQTPSPLVTGDLGLDSKVLVADGRAWDCTMLSDKSNTYRADQTYIDCVIETDCDAPYTANSPFRTILQSKCGYDQGVASELATRIAAGLPALTSKIIVRCWKATDHYGNSSAPCYQIIFVKRFSLYDVIFPGDAIFNCAQSINQGDCKYDAAPADCEPASIFGKGGIYRGLAYPFIDVNGNKAFDFGTDIVLDGTANTCNITVERADNTPLVPCVGSRKQERTWTVKDWCTGHSISDVQLIKVLDFNEPVVTAEYNDYASTATSICYIDQWNQQKGLDVYTDDGAQRKKVSFDGYWKQCGAEKVSEVTNFRALADANQCGRYFVSLTITACDPKCTNDVVTVTSSNSNLTGRRVREFKDAQGINNYVYEFSGFLYDGDQNGYEDFAFTAADKCGYALAMKSFRANFIDNAKPQPICISSHTATLGTDGTVRIPASVFDNGSRDNCGIHMVMVRRMDGKKCVNGGDCGTLANDLCDNGAIPYRDYVEFGCCDAGKTLQVELLVLDQAGNFNSCMVNVTIQNKNTPVCIPPANQTIACTDIAAARANPVAYGLGTAAAYYSCGFTLAETDQTAKIEPCYPSGANYFDRNWKVTPCDGSATLACSQRIFITNKSDFTVDFPDDLTVNCAGGIPSADALKAQMLDPTSWNTKDGAIKNDGCGVIAVEIKDEVFMATPEPNVCIKVLRRIRVIDWCKYNPNNDAVDQDANCYGLPVCGDYHRVGGTSRTSASRAANQPAWQNLDSEAGSRNVTDCNGDGVIDARTSPTSRDISHFDRRFRDADGLVGPSNNNTNPTHPNSFSDGIICFTQIIKVIDNVPPTSSHGPVSLCVEAGCKVNYSDVLTAEDECGDGSYKTTQGLSFFWTITNADPVKSGGASVVGTGTTAAISATGLGIGTYTVSYFVKDRCGNQSAQVTYTITVKDCKAPEVLAHVKVIGLAWADTNNDGRPDAAMAQLCVDDIKNNTADNCTDKATLESRYSIEKGDKASTGYPAGSGKGVKCIMFTCDDFKKQAFQFPVRLWTIDDAGNANFALTYVDIQDQAGACSGNPRPLSTIASTVGTENNQMVNGVKVTATMNGTIAAGTATTGATGAITMPVDANQIYLVKSIKETTEDKYAGVTTFDIARISKHVLDIEKLASAYQIIAADVDKSGSVDAADMLHIRNFILRKTSSLPGGVWRFIDKSYSFRNAADPFSEDFSEVVNITNPAANTTANANFVAVKLGDVNATYTSNLVGTQVRNSNALTLVTEDIKVIAGNEYTIVIGAENFNASAFQGTFNVANALVKSVKAGDLTNMSDANFGLFNNAITTSWNGKASATNNVMSITFVANKSGNLSDILTISSELTPAVANDAAGQEMNVNLKFTSGKVQGGEFALYQNTPNPVANQTSISFNLPKESSAKLTIYNVEGKVIKAINGEYKAGLNQVELNKSELGVSGVLYYRLDTPEFSATKKMIIIE